MVTSLNVDGNIVSTTQYSKDEPSRGWHFHESPHVCFVFRGGQMERNSRSSKEQKTNGVYFYRAGEAHRWKSHSSISTSANIELGKGFLGKYGIVESQVEKTIENSLDSKFLVLKIQREMRLNDYASNLAITSLILELFSRSKTSTNGSVPTWITVLEELLNDRWDEHIPLQELSHATGVHPTTISKHFRKYFYCTLGEYVRKLKIDKSISLIKNSGRSITDIAFQCGFSDHSHFTRNFKEITGFLPKEFRNL